MLSIEEVLDLAKRSKIIAGDSSLVFQNIFFRVLSAAEDNKRNTSPNVDKGATINAESN